MAQSKPFHYEYVLGLTAFAAGAVDVISFTKLGGIFASAMTGNLAFLGLYIARGALYSAIGSLIALIGFVLGASAGTLMTRNRDSQKAVTVLLASETALLLGATILWLFVSHRNGRLSTDALILTLSIAMGLQGIIGKKINLSSIPTIVFTSTLTNIVVGITDAVAEGKLLLPTDTRRQLVSFFLYFFGAIAAGLLSFFNFNLIVSNIDFDLSNVIIALPLAVIALAFIIHVTRKTS